MNEIKWSEVEKKPTEKFPKKNKTDFIRVFDFEI